MTANTATPITTQIHMISMWSSKISAPISVTPGDMLTWFWAAASGDKNAKTAPENTLPIACVLRLFLWRSTPSH